MSEEYRVAILASIYHVLRAEKFLKEKGLSYKVIPVPRHLSSDCGVCLRFPAKLEAEVLAVLEARVEIEGIHPL